MLFKVVAVAAFLMATGDAMAQMFTNNSGCTLTVRYVYGDPSLCPNFTGFNVATVAPTNSVTFPAPPTGTFYFSCVVTANGVSGTPAIVNNPLTAPSCAPTKDITDGSGCNPGGSPPGVVNVFVVPGSATFLDFDAEAF